jgi:hypothetical protein
MVQVTRLGGTGKAEAAKLPGAGIGPKLCPGKCAAEKVRPTRLSAIGVVSDARQRLAGARVSGRSQQGFLETSRSGLHR